jgi:hypothetical protein
VGENTEALRLEASSRGGSEPEVLERATGEDDGAWLPDLGTGSCGGRGNGLVEGGGDFGRRAPGVGSM